MATLLRRPPRWVAWTVLLMVVGGSAFLAGMLAERQGRLTRLQGLWNAIRPATLSNYLHSVGAEVDTLVLDIKHQHYERLAGQRQVALERGQITEDLKQYVPARLTWQDQTMKVDLRLKGEWTDHLMSDKWSFRVKIDEDKRLFGMRRFSLQHPKARSYLDEWLYLAALRRAGVTALRYRFVRVVLNGKDLGIHALEEHFGKELIEHHQTRTGVVLHFDASYRYEPVRGRQGAGPVETGIGEEQVADILLYGQDKVEQDPVLARQYRQAVTLLESFRRGQVTTQEAFDLGPLAWYFAISELMGTHATAADWSDMRFLYDPVSSRLSPIGVEGSQYDSIRSVIGARARQQDAVATRLHTRLFADDRFWEAYIQALKEVSQPAFLESLLADLGEELDQQRRILHQEFPYRDLDLGRIRRNASILRAYLAPKNGIHVYPVGLGGAAAPLEVGVIQPMPVEITGAGWGSVVLPLDPPLRLPGRSPDAHVEFHPLRLPTSSESSGTPDLADLRVRYRLAGLEEEWWVTVPTRPRFDPALRDADLPRHAPTTDSFPFLQEDREHGTWTVPAGRWQVSSDLVFPAGQSVRFVAGAHLDLTQRAAILVRGPVHAGGTEEVPVVFESTDGTGQGVVVLEAGGRSILKHTIFRGLGSIQRDGWELTGATTFFRSPVEFHDCHFQGGVSEDVLNVIHSEVILRQTVFSGATSDAFDGDFVVAVVEDCRFQDIAGDALDVSGSQVEVRGMVAHQVRDKAVSIGEASSLQAQRIQVTDSRIGVAVKDLSNARVHTLMLQGVTYGTAVFQKKPEYGPSSLWVHDMTFEDGGEAHLTEPGSRLFVDWLEMPADRADLRALLYADEDA